MVQESFPYRLPDHLAEEGLFYFARLVLEGIDNDPVLKVNDPAMAREEVSLFHRDFSRGDEYFAMLHDAVTQGVADRRALPVVRFADGEYAFYGNSLACNGLYKQAESLPAIRKAMPSHVRALRRLAQSGIAAPLIFPGNTAAGKKRRFPKLPWIKKKPSASTFLEFLRENDIQLTKRNYVPFYVVYAYLTSEDFSRLVHARKVCLLNSDENDEACRRWFERFSSRPELVCIHIPAEYVATRWETMRDDVLADIPPDIDICLVGAGVGALPVCVDVAEHFSIPAIDAGHVLNMMNGREDKSNGPRLYTLRNR
jgi:hypothetical protein